MGIAQMFAAVKPVVMQQGVAHGTPALRNLHTLTLGKKKHPKKRKHKVKAKGTHKRRKAKKSHHATVHTVKGSRAAKTHMAKLRALRGTKKTAVTAGA